MAIATQPTVIPLWPTGAPGSEDWTQVEQSGVTPDRGMKAVWNVTQPTLTAYLPDPAVATGAAVIVCPGGAFHFLAIEHEGTQVAEWLAERGIAAFILKYRLLKAPNSVEGMQQQMRDRFANREEFEAKLQPYRQLIVADSQQAMRTVRQRAGEWGIRPDRIGIMGFSAGGFVTVAAALLYDAGTRPDFAAPIYPAPWRDIQVPPDAPPLFLVLASDDKMAVGSSIPLYQAWNTAGLAAELHIFSQGGHGFGMRTLGLPVDRWIELFHGWLGTLGVLNR